MSIPVTCPQCGAINKVNESLAGRRFRCPECDTAVHVPEREIEQSPPPLPEKSRSKAKRIQRETSAADHTTSAPEIGESIAESPAVPAPGGLPPSTAAEPGPQPDAASIVPGGDDWEDDEPVLQRSKRDEEELDMTPMVDVTFLLLIFFMVTAAFSLQKSIEMPRQQTDAPSTTVVEEEEEDLEMVEVQVDEFGSFLVLAPDWEQETPGKQNLITALKRAIEGSSGMRLVIKVHEQCKLQYLVDAMDAGTIAGYAETQVTQVEEFD
ncbi:biopolymer transporter ExbD [Roseiconus nitratireducens]|uniref:Biopolymer transporter ExbD n=1 Tax=Roseiconus nitratireducens TaxID=2605748 RepID=A0A5M6D0J9_9BACT|nr:biopolymer transporter ExbD [Roseiconus nitratireducens]KAA5541001.1 biopolymer transporter ExbD [Roseiconus nitratireducens]